MRRGNVVIIARVIDVYTQDELGEFKTIQPVDFLDTDTPAAVVEYALEIADDVKDWETIGSTRERSQEEETRMPSGFANRDAEQALELALRRHRENTQANARTEKP